MPRVSLLLAVLAVGSSAWGRYAFEEDFSVVGADGGVAGVDLEENTLYSHKHRKVEDGRYAILLSGNRHYLATPALRDFSFAMDWGFERLFADARDLGFRVRFHDDRAAYGGHELAVFCDNGNVLHLTLDGADFHTRKIAPPELNFGGTLRLTVSGSKGRVEVAGETAEFVLPDGDRAGYISVDSLYSPGMAFVLKRLSVESSEEPARTRVGTWHLALSGSQGFPVPPVYDVTVDRFATGETLIEATLSGTQLGRGTNRIETGGTEWCSAYDRLTMPYVRIDPTDGGRPVRLNFWNGMKQIYDKLLYDRKIGSARWLPEISWPRTVRTVVRGFPADFTVAAGYERAVNQPWRFVANGPWEQVQDAKGTVLFEGAALDRGGIAVKASSAADKKMTRLIPKDLPGYAAALRHAEREHYFFESEPVAFTVEKSWRAAAVADAEVAVDAAVTDVYGEKLSVPVETGAPTRVTRTGGIRQMRYAVRVGGRLACGVYHLVAGGERITFEVLSDDPNGPCPPLASGLPEFVSMPNEIKYLETDAFDPWSERGGISHYYTTVNRYPAVAKATELWRILPLYRRRWFCWCFKRNTDDWDCHGENVRDVIRHCDVFGGDETGTPIYQRFDFSLHQAYTGLQLQIVKEFYEKFRGRTIGDAFPREDVERLIENDWRDFLPFARRRADEMTAAFDDYVFRTNPKVGLGSYGPMSIYTSHYKSPYSLMNSGRSIDCDPRVRENGSFWLLEEYHFSCDYPICRASYYVAGYDLMYPNGRRIYPEIYYSAWDRCLDGAVFRAHPMPTTEISPLHQRRIAYQYVYATPHFRDGRYGYWTDDGFHARNPERESMDEFVYAWGKTRRNRPATAPKSPFVVLDRDQIWRHGDHLETDNSWLDKGAAYASSITDVDNTAEEGIGYVYERCCLDGYVTPVVTDLRELDRLTPDKTEFVVLPPIVAGTPPETLAAIRRLHARGVNLLCSESVVGLEDLFGVKPASPRKLGWVPGEPPFSHKLAIARYAADGAETVFAGAERAGGATDIPVVLLNRPATGGRTAFVNVPPTVVRRSPVREGYSLGQDTVSKRMSAAMTRVFAFLAERPALCTERGSIAAAFTAKGDLVVIPSDDAPTYGDTDVYPVSFRFTVAVPGVGNAAVESDAPYSVVSREPDRLVIRTSTEKRGAPFFVFRMKEAL